MNKHYTLIQACIEWLTAHGNHSTTLEHLSAQFHMEAGHLQKVFKQYVGLTPKQYIQNLMLLRSRPIMAESTIEQASLDLGLSSSARLYDTYIKLTAMTPGEFRSMGQSLVFQYAMEQSALGNMLAVTTSRGLFYLGFHNDPYDPINALKSKFPCARFEPCPPGSLLGCDPVLEAKPTELHISGSAFQLKVWQALLSVPPGSLTTYGSLANAIDKPTAARAIGQAVGANPIAALIPCHRVIQRSGALGGYRWGEEYKQAMLSIEHSL